MVTCVLAGTIVQHAYVDGGRCKTQLLLGGIRHGEIGIISCGNFSNNRKKDDLATKRSSSHVEIQLWKHKSCKTWDTVTGHWQRVQRMVLGPPSLVERLRVGGIPA